MKSKRTYTDYIRDILETIDKAERFVEGMSFDEFINDDRTTFAAVRALEIIGEASKNLPQPLKDGYPQVFWQDIVAMRNRIVHAYFGVDLEIVWETIHDDLPILKPVVAQMLADAEREAGE